MATGTRESAEIHVVKNGLEVPITYISIPR